MIPFFRLGIAAVALCFAPQSVLAQSQADTGQVTTIVDNSFTVVEVVAADVADIAIVVAPLTLGTATYTLNPNGSITIVNSGTDARFFQVDSVGRSPGTIDVSGAAPNTSLNLSFLTTQNLRCAACSGGNPEITLGSYVSDVGLNPTTDGAGDLTINFGFTLTTLAGQTYEDGTYTGTYQVTVSY